MEEYKAKVINIKNVTHDVKSFTVAKPEGYSFKPGQATEVAINKNGLKEERRPFTFTSLNEDPNLEFTIKIYPKHDGVTDELDNVITGDELLIHDVWGAIEYKGEGCFIAGGAGVTPFIAIFRQLEKDGKLGNNKLIFSNKTDKDIILKEEFEKMLGDNFVNIITKDENSKYYSGRIDKELLKKHVDNFDKNFYVCGPPEFTKSISEYLSELGAETDSIIFEK